MCKVLSFPGLWGIVVGVGVFLALWLLAWLVLKGDTFVMDAKGKEGAFESRLSNYLDIAKFVLGLASGSVVLLIGSTTFHDGGIRLPQSYASPLFLPVLSIVWGLLFMVLETLDYEAYQHKSKPYTRGKYARNNALGFGCLLCFCGGYVWLIVIATARP
jgi:heme/copper-type cytochrome/quinol oxidase subunit 3